MRRQRSLNALALWVAILAWPPACSRPTEQAAAPPAQAAEAHSAASGNALVTGRAPAGAVVMLEPSTPREFPMPAGSVIMDQYSKAFVPEVLIARTGQTVEFRNSEDIVHNVIVIKQPTGKSVFAVSRSPFDTYEHKFVEPGVYAVSCDIHPGMRAALVVTSTPYTTVVDGAGGFSFVDVPPGAYKVVVSGEGRNVERAIDIAAPKTEVEIRE